MADEEHAMDDRDRAEMQALCDQFRREMAREVDEPLFDHDARARIGQAIGRSARQGRSDYAACEGGVIDIESAAVQTNRTSLPA